ncbi:MAG: OmpA family protein [Cellulophaga sp.]
MKENCKYLVVIITLISFLSYGQKSKKADKNYESYAFMAAIENYKSLDEKGFSNFEIYQKLGDANYINANYIEASKWYLKLLELQERSMLPAYIYRYSQCLKSMGNYEESKVWMEEYITKVTPDNSRANKYRNQKNYLEGIEKNSGRYTIENRKENSSGSDFGPSITKEGFYFASARDTGFIRKRIHDWNNGGFLDIYSSENGKATKLSKAVNTKYHESTSIISKDGKSLYFTRNNFVNGKVKRDGKDIMRLKIYKASWVKGTWREVRELPFSSDLYSVAHPALSADEKKLYFVSDMPSSIGASDIYYVAINENGSFGEPVNLGVNVNTEGKESFPFISKDGILFFASDGHQGLGGLDVYAVEEKDIFSGKVLNLGKPVNGPQDDFSYVVDSEINEGYFASNRKGGKGSDDIYSFVEVKPLLFKCVNTISGVARDVETFEVLANVAITLSSTVSNEIKFTQTDDFGRYTFNLDCSEGSYQITASKELFNALVEDLEFDKSKSVQQALLLEKQDLTEVLGLNPIYFDYNKSSIRKDAALELQKIITYMQSKPNVKVEVRSHTDSRGKDAYNLKLSDKRAKATAAYIISKGIDYSRIKGVGYGETEITNGCINGVDCSGGEHQSNRKSEFIVRED